MKRIRKIILIALLWYSPQCYANEVTSKDVEIISNLLKYAHGLNSSSHKIAVLYDPASEQSQKEAHDFASKVEQSADAKAAAIETSLIPINELAGKSGFNIAYISTGLSSHTQAIHAFAQEHKILTLSTDMACATNDCCVISIQNGPSIDIYLNEKTMATYGLDVDATFKFMVKKV
ncbi:MAG: hypothetical protein ACHP6I_02820 [Rickettsiales bacterium]